MEKKLRAVVEVDAQKCVNCHACISACPVKFCNDASGDSVKIRQELCIGCGQCIEACSHQARRGLDDFPDFLALAGRQAMVAISAPALAANFPGSYLRLQGWLASLGVKAFFDVSFGAELTVRSYLEHIKRNKPASVIAQPCPALVNYIEIYRPELIEYLAPADSPMMHSAKMIREFFPRYSNCAILVLSPCYAKAREFDEVGQAYLDSGQSAPRFLNVTYASLERHIRESGIRLSDYPETDFSGPLAERAVLFSSPGGLMRTALRENPALLAKIRKIEGPKSVYPYFDALAPAIRAGHAPLIIDCLNCERGCNGGTATLCRHDDLDAVESRIEARLAEIPRRRLRKATLNRNIRRYWRPGLYRRDYVNRGLSNSLRQPDESQLSSIYRSMAKTGVSDIYNCASCGYGSCRDMAVAIFNGLNRPENCHHFLVEGLKKAEGQREKTAQAGIERLRQISQDLIHMLEQRQAGALSLQLKSDAAIQSMRGLSSIVNTIEAIARETNLLSLNASIESGRAGESGKGFAVVADRVRTLALKARDEAQRAAPYAEEAQATIKEIADMAKGISDYSTDIQSLESISRAEAAAS